MTTQAAITAALQRRILATVAYVTDYHSRYRVAPTVEEVARAVGLKSRGTAYAYLNAAVHQGLLVLAETPGDHIRGRNLYLPLASTCPTCGKSR